MEGRPERVRGDGRVTREGKGLLGESGLRSTCRHARGTVQWADQELSRPRRLAASDRAGGGMSSRRGGVGEEGSVRVGGTASESRRIGVRQYRRRQRAILETGVLALSEHRERLASRGGQPSPSRGRARVGLDGAHCSRPRADRRNGPPARRSRAQPASAVSRMTRRDRRSCFRIPVSGFLIPDAFHPDVDASLSDREGTRNRDSGNRKSVTGPTRTAAP